MSLTADGTHECDKCGTGVENGSISVALVVSDKDPDQPGMVRTLHFCRDREEADGTKIKGCDKKVLSPANLKHYEESRA